MRMAWWIRSLFMLLLVGITGTVAYFAQELSKPKGLVFAAGITFICTVLAFLLGMWAQTHVLPTEDDLNQPGTRSGRILTGIAFLAVMLPTLLYLFRTDFVPLAWSGGAPAYFDDAKCVGRWDDLKVCNQDPRWTTGVGDGRPTTFTLEPVPETEVDGSEQPATVDGIDGTVRIRNGCPASRKSLAAAMVTDFRITVDGAEVAGGTVNGEGVVSLSARQPVPATVTTVTVTAEVGEDDVTECLRFITVARVLQRDAWGFWQ